MLTPPVTELGWRLPADARKISRGGSPRIASNGHFAPVAGSGHDA